ncbi:MAG: hypothetical protein MUF48_23115, partial [Pirellulaceae bacterium]|nr:hypothetical protein [Pirellulaceae bacterium]
MTIAGNAGRDTVYIDGDLKLPGRDLDVSAEKILVGFVLGEPNDVSDWEPGAKYADCSPQATSGTGTGMAVEIHVDSAGVPRVLVTNSGTGYAIGDTVTFVCPEPGAGSPVKVKVLSTGKLGLSVSTRDTDLAGSITLTAEDNHLPQWWTYLSPVDVGSRRAAIMVSGAAIDGGRVTIRAAAEDTNFYDGYGDYKDVFMENLLQVLGQIPDLAVSSALGISGQVAVHRADARISVVGSSLTGTDSVEIGSTAHADASLHTVAVTAWATGGYFTLGVGYGQAQSTAITNLDRTTVVADGAVDVTSNATTKAFVKARTHLSPVLTKNPKNVSIAVAVADTHETSHVTISEGSSITSRQEGVNVSALGGVTNFAWSQPEIDGDGIASVAFSVDVDIADVKARVDGAIDAAGGVGNSFDAREGQDVNYHANTIRIPDHGFTDGQQVTYSHGLTDAPLGQAEPPDIDGLTDGDSYYVQVVDKDTIRLAHAPTIDLDNADLDLGADPQHSLGRLAMLEFASTGVDPADGKDTIAFAPPHGFTGGEALTYIGTYNAIDEDGVEQNRGVGGLEHGRTYYVVTIEGDDATIRLAESPDGTLIDLTDAGVGRHGFLYQKDIVTFSPGTSVVDPLTNTLTFSEPHPYSTGDAVVYHTDPTIVRQRPFATMVYEQDLAVVDSTTLTIPGNQTSPIGVGTRAELAVGDATVESTVVSVTYDDTSDRTTVVLAQEVITDTLTRAAFASTTMVTESDAPIAGLADAHVYYVVKMDDHSIRLASTKAAAEDAAAINLRPATDWTGTGLGTAHTLKSSNWPDGICVQAGLAATNAIYADSQIEFSTNPVPLGWELFQADRTMLQAEEIVDVIRQVVNKISGKQPDQSPVKGGTSFGVGGSIAVNYADHDVEAIIGPTARLTCSQDIAVSATIDQGAQVAAVSGVSKPKDSEYAVALAIGLGIFNNTAKATVEGGATLDAHGAITVDSAVNYGFLISNPLSAINPFDYFKNIGPEGFAFFMDGTLGFASNLFNTFVMTAANQSKVGAGGSFAINIYNNTSEARIETGAKLNQRADSRFRDGVQSVDVNAVTDMNLIGVVGVGALGLNFKGGYKAFKTASGGQGSILQGLQQLVNPFGAEGDKGGVGASFLVEVITNTTEAVIERGALVHTGTTSLTVAARTGLFDFALAEAGGKASSFGVAGAFPVSVVTNTTKAHIDAGAVVTSDGSVSVSATDDLTRIGIAGGIVVGANTGVGVSVSVNVVNRNTQAYIGAELGTAAEPSGTDVTAAGPITVRADSTGALWTASVAAAVTGAPPSKKEIADNEAIKKAPQKAQSVLGETGQTYDLEVDVGYAGDVSVNVLDEETYAYVRDTKIDTDARLTVESTNDTEIWSLAGSVAISLKGEKSSRGLAASISANIIHNDTQAFIADSTVDAESLSLLAKRTGTTRSLTASGSGAFVKEGLGIAMSFSANVMLDTVEAYILDSTATLAGSSSIQAENACEILAIGGALAYGGKYGFGVGVAVNLLGSELDVNMTRAYVENSTVTIASGTLDVKALNDNPGDDPRILAVTGSLG